MRMPSLAQRLIRSLMANPAWAAHVELPDYLPPEEDAACLADIADFVRSRPALPDHAQIWEHFRGSRTETVLHTIYRQSGAADEGGAGEEDETAFADGLAKLAKSLRAAQLDILKQKATQGGLTPAEKKLLLHLLAER